jgi:type I restriction enzyme S subunit
MCDWKDYKLADVAIDFAMGPFGSNIKAENFIESGVPVIRGKNLNFYKYIDGDFVYLSDEKADELKKSNCFPDDLVFTHRGTIGQVGLIPKNKYPRYVVSQSGMKLTVDKNKIDENYLFYFFKSDIGQYELLKNESQVGVPAISSPLSSLKSVDIKLPPLPEQKAIASVLSSLDDKIDLLHRQNKTLEAMAETIFRQWFVEEAQEDWEEKPLAEVVKIAIGRTPPRKEFHWFSTNSSDVKWVSIKDLGESGVFVFDTSEYLTKEAVETFNIPIIPKDTVLLSFKMTVGRVGITTEPMLSNEAIAHFKFDENTNFSKEYLYIFLKIFKYDSLGSTSSIVTSINSSMIKEMKIVIPDDVTMNNFKSNTEPLFNKIRQNQIQIRTLEKLRDTLLPKLMSGEVRVKI